MEVGDMHKVWEIRALKRKPDEPSARALLDRIARQVQPVMRRRKWRVKVLSEFSPKNPRLLGLNVNRGVEVKLRLRTDSRDREFIPYEEVLDTMLHELAHIARGPHDAQFYKLWDQLRKPLAPICEVCGTAKPKIAKAKYTTWSCKFCTLENSVELEKCSTCDQWRYSYGPPVATYSSSCD